MKEGTFKITIPESTALLTTLTKDHKSGDKYIHTTNGVFKIRKNGRMMLAIDDGENREFVRCHLFTPKDER